MNGFLVNYAGIFLVGFAVGWLGRELYLSVKRQLLERREDIRRMNARFAAYRPVQPEPRVKRPPARGQQRVRRSGPR